MLQEVLRIKKKIETTGLRKAVKVSSMNLRCTINMGFAHNYTESLLLICGRDARSLQVKSGPIQDFGNLLHFRKPQQLPTSQISGSQTLVCIDSPGRFVKPP